MTSPYVHWPYNEMRERLRGENESLRPSNDPLTPDGQLNNHFSAGSRPGSGRRPKQLPVGTSGPGRSRMQQVDLPGSTYVQSSTVDSAEIDRKIREIKEQTGNICIKGVTYATSIKDLEDLGELGNGTCGHVVKMLHKPSQTEIAVKQMRRSGNVDENKRITMDLEVVLKSHDCDYIVKCLGCFVTDLDVWICMELMATCFDKLLKRLSSPIPEDIIGKVALATVKALHYLKEKRNVIHRDIKPSNILLDHEGNVKLCDFGISGRLVDSKAKSKNAGCAAYMAPERISPPEPGKTGYDIRADVWSLGITLVELATGEFPYPNCKCDFDVLCQVIQNDPPSLPPNQFSPEFEDFIRSCLTKDYRLRPKYPALLEHPFLKRYETKYVDVAAWYSNVTSSPRVVSPSLSSSQKRNLLRSLSDRWKNRDPLPSNQKACYKSAQKSDFEGLKGVWNSLMRSPLFNRKKKTVDPPLPDSLPKKAQDNPCPPPLSPNASPIVLERFLHQQIQHMNEFRRSCRSASVSPTRRYNDTVGFDDGFYNDLKCMKLQDQKRNSCTTPTSKYAPSPSPEPPPRINKMVSPLLMRRIAFNNVIPYDYTHPYPPQSPCSPRRHGFPPQPPPRRKQYESSSVPCSPLLTHRGPLQPRTAWDQYETSYYH